MCLSNHIHISSNQEASFLQYATQNTFQHAGCCIRGTGPVLAPCAVLSLGKVYISWPKITSPVDHPNSSNTLRVGGLCFELMQALADINIGTINLNNKELDANATIQQAIGRLQQTCLAVGIDMLGGISHKTAATPLEELQQMLNRYV